MKLNEIFDTKDKSRSTPDLSQHDRPFYSTKQNQLGYGKYSYVTQKKADPHLVTKVQNKAASNLANDGYFSYIKYIVDNKIAQRNPYAPRVYKINKFKDTAGNEKYTIDMEKLVDIEDISGEELAVVYKMITGLESNADDVNALRNKMTFFLGKHLSGDTNNPNLDEVLKIIDYLLRENDDFILDIHDGNIMFRRTPHGVQLVITDPLSQRTRDPLLKKSDWEGA